MSKETNKGARIKKRIIDQAIHILEDKGFTALNICNIVKKCNISKTTFYKYFSSKDELLETIREHKENNADVITRRDEILNKASEAFFRLGVEEIDMDSIAKASAISRPSLYRYFSSKEELLEYAVQYELKKRQASLLSIKSETDDPRKQLEILLNIGCDATHQHYDSLMLITCRYKLYKNERIKKYFNELVSSTIEMIADILEKGKEKGVIKNDIDSSLMSTIFLALFNGISFNHEHDAASNPNQIKRSAYDLFNKIIIKE